MIMAPQNMNPDYEVKCLMQPSVVLCADHKLTPAVLAAFSMPAAVTNMNVQFLDTNARDLYTAGWSPRIRKIEDEDDFELTYKKRYPVDTDGGGGNIDAALTVANTEGFDAKDDKYDAQIEWGYRKQTLSISRKKNYSDSGHQGMDLPSLDDSIKMLVREAPGKLEDWRGKNWGKALLEKSRIYGPVLAKRSVGIWGDLELNIEIWPLPNSDGTGTDYVIEASFKTTDEAIASAKHDELIAFLEEKGWFLPQDSLKTAIIMERF